MILRRSTGKFDSGDGRHDIKPRWQHGRMYTGRRMGIGLGAIPALEELKHLISLALALPFARFAAFENGGSLHY
jgi:hypothetical protein